MKNEKKIEMKGNQYSGMIAKLATISQSILSAF